MARPYQQELNELAETYAKVVAADPDFPGVTNVIAEVSRGNAIYVGSGGTLAMAALAAREHIQRTSRLARSMTPLELVSLLANVNQVDAHVVVFSSRGRHPDIRVAASAARGEKVQSLSLVTQLKPDALAETGRLFHHVASVPQIHPDGFLATNGLLAMATAWARATGHTVPIELPSLGNPPRQFLSPPERVLILFDPSLAATAVDLEARLSESGIADVQLADFRNMAHGRHVGLARQVNGTGIVVLSGPASADLARSTISTLPEHANLLRLTTELPGISGELDTLAAGMLAFGDLARQLKIDPGRPRVGKAGRALYHLPWQKRYSIGHILPAPINRKLRALSRDASDHGVVDVYTQALNEFVSRIKKLRFTNLVLDYDGTCCRTAERYDPPQESIRRELLRLLDEGLRLGFASGRGPSLPEGLKRWIPKEFWHQIFVALYNGGLTGSLAEEFPHRTGAEGALAQVADHIRTFSPVPLNIEVRPYQVTITPQNDSGHGIGRVIEDLVAQRDDLQELNLASSAHSVDIFPISSSKTNILAVMGADPLTTVAIGDQGQLRGNDHALLAQLPHSLSVDRVSADPTRCWNLDLVGAKGPDALVEYLKSIRAKASGFCLTPAQRPRAGSDRAG